MRNLSLCSPYRQVQVVFRTFARGLQPARAHARPGAAAALVMTAPSLRDLWLSGKEGGLCAREQARAWALRDVWRAEGKGDYGLLPFVAARVRKTCKESPLLAKATPTLARTFCTVSLAPSKDSHHSWKTFCTRPPLSTRPARTHTHTHTHTHTPRPPTAHAPRAPPPLCTRPPPYNTKLGFSGAAPPFISIISRSRGGIGF